jgi:uncharacterized membrane protein
MYALELLDRAGLAFTSRWLHIVVGITWIGLLYYFNLVQVPAFAEMSASSRTEAIEVLVKRAVWWFRWAAVATVRTGLLIMGFTKDYFADNFGQRANGISISTGVLIALIMFVNVWGIIWRNQKVVIASAAQVRAGGEPLPEAAVAGRRAGMASRQNVFFSFAMIWFMTFTTHYAGFYDTSSGGARGAYWAITVIILAVLELNALGIIGGGLKPAKESPFNWPYETVRNVLISGFVLWAIFWLMWEILFAP